MNRISKVLLQRIKGPQKVLVPVGACITCVGWYLHDPCVYFTHPQIDAQTSLEFCLLEDGDEVPAGCMFVGLCDDLVIHDELKDAFITSGHVFHVYMRTPEVTP